MPNEPRINVASCYGKCKCISWIHKLQVVCLTCLCSPSLSPAHVLPLPSLCPSIDTCLCLNECVCFGNIKPRFGTLFLMRCLVKREFPFPYQAARWTFPCPHHLSGLVIRRKLPENEPNLFIDQMNHFQLWRLEICFFLSIAQPKINGKSIMRCISKIQLPYLRKRKEAY